jgi:hypothetical protein
LEMGSSDGGVGMERREADEHQKLVLLRRAAARGVRTMAVEVAAAAEALKLRESVARRWQNVLRQEGVERACERRRCVVPTRDPRVELTAEMGAGAGAGAGAGSGAGSSANALKKACAWVQARAGKGRASKDRLQFSVGLFDSQLVGCSLGGCSKQTADPSGYCKQHRSTEEGEAAVAAAQSAIMVSSVEKVDTLHGTVREAAQRSGLAEAAKGVRSGGSREEVLGAGGADAGAKTAAGASAEKSTPTSAATEQQPTARKEAKRLSFLLSCDSYAGPAAASRVQSRSGQPRSGGRGARKKSME